LNGTQKEGLVYAKRDFSPTLSLID